MPCLMDFFGISGVKHSKYAEGGVGNGLCGLMGQRDGCEGSPGLMSRVWLDGWGVCCSGCG